MSDHRAPETRALLQDHAQQDWRDVIDRLDAETLMIAARDSQVFPAEHAAAASEKNRRAHLLVFDDCGHAVHIDQPRALNGALLQFTGGL